MKKTYIPVIVLFILCTSRLQAQETVEEIERLLSKNIITYASAARLILEASDTMTTSDVHEAFQYAAERNWLPKNVAENDAARYDGVSLLIMQSFEMKGGIMYTITKSPHYAYRELVSKSIIQGRVDPAMRISGERLLFIVGKVLAQSEMEQ